MLKIIEPIEIISVMSRFRIDSDNSRYTIEYRDFLEFIDSIEQTFISFRVNASFNEFMRVTKMYENTFNRLENSIKVINDSADFERIVKLHSPEKEVFDKIIKLIEAKK